MLRYVLGGAMSLGLAACAAVAANDAPLRQLSTPPQASDSYFEEGHASMAALPPTRRARNVILFIGDGMGVTTVTAARIYAGQSRGVDGESYDLTMDTFPHIAHSRTYGADAQIADSAPTATALMSGVKTNDSVVGLSQGVTPGRCEGSDAFEVRTIFDMAEEADLATGVVSTARITHATPASAYAHAASRRWEADANLPANASCIDIARQLVEWPSGDGFEIALGGGRARFLPTTVADPEDTSAMGVRRDGRDLTAEWRARPNHVFVWNREQLDTAAPDAHILGLFSPSHMAYEAERDQASEPSLAEMTAAAIRRLQREPNGFVLMVEGGRIDHAHHDGLARHALNETVAFDEAIRTALEMTNRDDTLIIVTADHSHSFTMSGYPQRGNPILGLSANRDGLELGQDGRPFTTLGYANGPGALYPPQGEAPPQRPDLSDVDTEAWDYHQQALTPMIEEAHGGEDVAIYAWGPGDDAVHGTMEQNTVFHVMARALGFDWR